MNVHPPRPIGLALAFTLATGTGACLAAPAVSRLTPPSELFSNQRSAPVIARFLPGQRFDLQATLRPDDAAKTIVEASFAIDGLRLALPVALRSCASGCREGVPANAAIASLRALNVARPGLHEFSVSALQSDGQEVTARGNFEVVPLQSTGLAGPKVRNIIILLGDGMGAAQRTAARLVQAGYAQGKALAPLAMDTYPVTGMVRTSSLNSIVTDSSPGMTAYVSGNKNNNNEEGVFPDDTTDPFDNPRVEYLSEVLHRTQGKALGLVTTADVFDATPAGNAVHTSNRGAGTGIVDQYLDDRGLTGRADGRRPQVVPAGQRAGLGAQRAQRLRLLGQRRAHGRDHAPLGRGRRGHRHRTQPRRRLRAGGLPLRGRQDGARCRRGRQDRPLARPVRALEHERRAGQDRWPTQPAGRRERQRR
jgi:alkaline phosphatase